MINLYYLKDIFRQPSVSMDKLHKTNLLQFFNLAALLFVFPLGIKAIFTHDYTLSAFLLSIGFVLIGNYYYLKKSSNTHLASHIITILFFSLFLYLVYAGGIDNTGPLWISSFPLIALFLLGTRLGFIYISAFLVFSCIIFFFPFESALKADYTYVYKLRIILSFILITILTSLYEYSNNMAYNQMQNLKEELEYSSSRDYLTSLYNRRGYYENIKNMQNVQGTVLMCDIDHFKKVNDNYGHDAGDFVLQEIAKNIKNMLREDDMAVRWGGEEFFIFLPHTSLEDGHLFAEKLRKSIKNLPLNYENQEITVTLSIGIAEVGQHANLEDIINDADNAMYQAKQAGRDITVGFTA